jgi:hypothetical protein
MMLTIERYLIENIDDHITITQWLNKNKLPIFSVIFVIFLCNFKHL